MNKHDEFWRHQATKEDYADLNIPTEEQVKYIVAAIKPVVFANEGSILEFGCGYGRLAEEVKKAFPKSTVVGVDINPHVMPTDSKGVLYYAAADIKGIPIKDAIYCVQVLQHMPNDRKREFIVDAANALSRAGVLVIQYVEGDSDTFLTHDAQFKDVSEWLADAGFEIASVEHNLIQDRWTWVTAVKKG